MLRARLTDESEFQVGYILVIRGYALSFRHLLARACMCSDGGERTVLCVCVCVCVCVRM